MYYDSKGCEGCSNNFLKEDMKFLDKWTAWCSGCLKSVDRKAYQITNREWRKLNDI